MLIYLDNSATTKQYNQVTTEMIRVFEEEFGNPSSLHRLGLNSEKTIKKARENVAQSLGVQEEEIIFTSGGTEADNMAILGVARSRRRKGNKIITSKVEHAAVLESCKRLEKEGFQVVYIDVDKLGIIDIKQLESEIDKDTILISIMHINNEVGAIQPIEEIYKLKENYARENGTSILLHVDAVQSYGKLELKSINADLISISGHKVHGPKGVGALYVKKGIIIEPIILGGGQEKGIRSGTENVPAIAGFGVAAKKIFYEHAMTFEKLENIRNYFIEEISKNINDIKWNSNINEKSSPSIVNVSFTGLKGEVLLHFLEQEGIYVSTGSACSSNKKGQSHVLKAMNLKDNEIEGAIRFSFSEFNTKDEINITIEKLSAIVNRMRKLKGQR